MNELTYLCYLARSTPNAQIFEFGTSVGRTTLNLSLNVDGAGRVFSLDLPQDYRNDDEKIPYALIQQAEVEQFTRASYISEYPAPLPIQLLSGNSLKFDFSPYYGRMDLVFIDGGHSLDVVTHDSEQAFRMLKPNSGVIVWHDYWSFNCPEVVRSVNSLTGKYRIYQVMGTRMALYLKAGDRGVGGH
jgi:predicted O-methyltransferase YrrM